MNRVKIEFEGKRYVAEYATPVEMYNGSILLKDVLCPVCGCCRTWIGVEELKDESEVSVRTISPKQMRNAYEYMVSHGCKGVDVDGVKELVDTADTWDANGRRDCFTTGDLGVQIRKVPDKELKPYYDEAVRIVNETFPEQCGVMVECFVRLNMFMEIASSALKDIVSGDLHPRMWGNCAAVALADMEKDASKFPRPFGWKFGKGCFKRNAEVSK